MKKRIALLLLLCAQGTVASVRFNQCISYDGKLSSIYVSCINNNLQKAARSLGNTPVFYCRGGRGQSINRFVACVNNNFLKLQTMTNGLGYLNYCNSFGDKVSQGFMSCTQRNFTRLATYINTVDEEQRRQLD